MTPREELELRRKLGSSPTPRAELELRRQLQQSGAPASPRPGQAPPTLQQRSKEVYGFKDYERRGTLLPLGRTKEGKTELALPQIAVDMAESALLPGHVYKGGSYTPEDALRFTLDYAAPMTAHKSGASRKALAKSAPTADDLKGQAKALKTGAVGSGATVGADDYLDLMADMEKLVRRENLHPTLHPKAAAVFDILSKNLGKDMDVEDMMTARRLIGVAQRSVTPEAADERRIAGMMEDLLDDFVDTKMPTASPALKQFRTLWHRAKKVELVDDVVEKAQTAGSGFENGLRTGFRSLLNNKKQIRGFSPDEVALMKQIVEGTSKQKMLRLLGKLSFGTRGGSNWLGGTVGSSLGASVGASVGGPLGAAIGAAGPPLVGYAAQKGAEGTMMQGANLLRAMAGTGSRLPPSATQQGVFNLLMQGAGPTTGALMPRQSGLMDDEFIQRHGGLANVF